MIVLSKLLHLLSVVVLWIDWDVNMKQGCRDPNDRSISASWILIELPNTTIIWSQILPRLKWRYSANQTAMHESRYRMNNYIASFVTKLGGHYIRYPDICRNYTFLKSDEVHLTPVGNDIFLNILQGAIEYFMSSNLGGLTFPTHNESI